MKRVNWLQKYVSSWDQIANAFIHSAGVAIHVNSPCKARETNSHEHVVTNVNMELAI